jgi:four helix bundle protein
MIARSFAGRKERAIMRKLPHHKLLAFEVAMKLLECVRDAKIRDAHLRDQAMRAAKSAVLNTAEGAGRVSRADKARAFTIARGEACEAAAAVEVAVAAGEADAAILDAVLGHADRFVALVTGLIR